MQIIDEGSLNISMGLHRLQMAVYNGEVEFEDQKALDITPLEQIVVMPEEIIEKVTNFLWKYDDPVKRRRLSNIERNILFDYFQISREQTKEVTAEDIAQKYYYDQPEPLRLAKNSIRRAVSKLHDYGDIFTELFYESREAAILAELEEGFSEKREIRLYDLLNKYQRECKRAGKTPNYSFVEIGRVIPDKNLQETLVDAGIINLQGLIIAFEEGSIKKVAEPDGQDYKKIRNNARNFFYHFGQKTPNILR